MMSSQCLTLGSRKIDCKRANIFGEITKKLDPSVSYSDDTCISLCHQSLLFNVILVPLFLVIPVPLLLGSRKKNDVMKVAPMMSSQCPDTGIQET
ncbi:hypothetical protein [Wolbachia endosymbiont of Dactylopius coccus]